MAMRLTRRGWGVVVLVGVMVLLGWSHGPRALNALVAPLIVALVGTGVSIYWAGTPRITRSSIENGFVGDHRTITVTPAIQIPVSMTLTDEVGDGLTVTDGARTGTCTDGDALEYTVELDQRGKRRVGPLSITVTDVLGLVSRTTTDRTTQPVIVYPAVYTLTTDSGAPAHLLDRTIHTQDRTAFDHLREYERGDSMRDVHWKSSAKRPNTDLVVKEFTEHETDGTVTIVGECQRGYADEAASAVASVAMYVHNGGLAVGISMPNADVEPGRGSDHLQQLLESLAFTGWGGVADETRNRADVLVQATREQTSIRIDGQEVSFDQLRGERYRGVTGRELHSSTMEGQSDPVYV